MTTLTNAQGCAVLRPLFEARGFRIQENVPFAEGPVRFDIDGWDPIHRVGYEFICSDSGDHDDLTPDEMATLAEWMGEGRLAIFLIDQADVRGEAELAYAAKGFLDDVERRRQGLE